MSLNNLGGYAMKVVTKLLLLGVLIIASFLNVFAMDTLIKSRSLKPNQPIHAYRKAQHFIVQDQNKFNQFEQKLKNKRVDEIFQPFVLGGLIS